MSRIDMCGCDVHLTSAGESPGMLQHIGPVVSPQSRIDHQRGGITNNNPDVGNDGYVVVGDHVHTLGHSNRLAPDDRRG